MRLTEFVVIIAAALLFLIPTMKQEKGAFERQMQEEAPVEELMEEANTYKVTFETKKPAEMALADIHWMKRAAEIARDAGIPYFNVLEQKVKKQDGATLVEGVIELDNDPMRAEFDAQEIESLVLTEQQ
jgi:hypothetical protein